MHRMNQRHLLCSLALCGALLSNGCATNQQEIPDPPQVELIRLQITKVRNAIEETRATISNSRGATYLPELYVRLAELLSEEARYHYQLAYEREQRSTRVLHVPQVRLLKEKSIETYELVLERFPNTTLADRVLFNIGHEHRELGNFDQMRDALKRLVEEHKESPLRADALLVLGDYHFDRNELAQAKTYYEQIVKGPLYRVSSLGQYKLAWVWVNFGECKKALDDFEDAIERAEEWETVKAQYAQQGPVNPSDTDGLPERPNNSPVLGTQQDIDVRRESLVDLTYCYSRERKVKDAIPYFKRYAYNRATYVASLDRLATRYRTIDDFDGAILVSRELLALGAADDLRVDDARTLYGAIKSKKAYDRLDEDLKLLTDVLTRSYTRIDISDEARAQLVEEFEAYARDLTTSGQEHLGKLKKDEQKAELAPVIADAYTIYLETFPDASNRKDMLLNLSDVLTIAGQDLQAGLRAIEASKLIEGEGAEAQKQDVLYGAIGSLQASLEQAEGRGHYERVTARAALRRAADELLATSLDAEKQRKIKFAVAQSYYDEGRFITAIDKLTAVAYEFPSSDEADAALQLVLDSYNTINDNDGLMLASRRFLDAASPASDPLKGRIKQVLAAAEQRKLDEISLQAAGEDGGDLTPLLSFAEQQKGTELGERALINAFVAARAIGDTDQMYTLADKLATEYPKSDQLPGIYTTLAQTAIGRFEYDRAVQTLEKAAQVNPDQRVRLLATSAELQEQLGDSKAALALYTKAISTSEGQAQAQAVAGYAELLERSGTASQIESKLASYADLQEPESLSRLGLALVAQGKTEQAEGYLQTVESDGSASPEALARANYGMAEVLYVTLKNYPTPDSYDLIEEFIAIVEVTQQSYLNAARQGSPIFSSASLSRLAMMLRMAADRLEKLSMPADLTPDEQAQVKQALDIRVKSLRSTADEALTACANQLWNNNVLNDIVVQCVQGNAWQKTLVPLDSITPRQSNKEPADTAKLRADLSKNPEDVEKLRQLGEKFLDAGDPHTARLIFARAIQLGGGPTEQNLLGIASYQIGDRSSAFSAFSAAAKGGLEAARQNLKKVLSQSNLGAQADEVDKKIPQGKEGGRAL